MTDSSEAAVVGGLYWLWATADQHTQDGLMPGLSLRQIDRKTGVQGLGKALCDIGWLSEMDAGVCLENFEEHNGQSAKRRCVDAQRKATVRTVSASDADKPKTEQGQETPNLGAREREEKRREEKEEDKGEIAPRKRAAPFPVPDWINREHWDAWHSCSKRRNATDKQKQLAVDKLAEWKAEGIDYAAALENAAIGGWQGLFKPDVAKAGASGAVNKQEALEQRNRGVASNWAAGIGHYV
jgi:hypothetical protein